MAAELAAVLAQQDQADDKHAQIDEDLDCGQLEDLEGLWRCDNAPETCAIRRDLPFVHHREAAGILLGVDRPNRLRGLVNAGSAGSTTTS